MPVDRATDAVRTNTRPTMKDVADRAGVSRTVVWYTLNGRADRPNVASEENRRRVLQAADELGYTLNITASSLRRQRTDRVCLITEGLGAPWSDLLASSLQESGQDLGYSIMTMSVESEEAARRTVQLLEGGVADGAVIAPMAPYFSLEALERLANNGFPLVLFHETAAATSFDVVRMREQSVCEAALEAEVAKGRDRIAYIGLQHELDGTPSPRMLAYTAVVERLGLSTDPELVTAGCGDRVASASATASLLDLPNPPNLIFAASDRAAISALWEAHRRGVDVPGSLAVLGTGNIPEGEITDPALSTVGQDRDALPVAAQLLFDRIRGTGPDQPQERVLDSFLTTRGST